MLNNYLKRQKRKIEDKTRDYRDPLRQEVYKKRVQEMKKTACERRAMRRAVLLAKGKVQKSGGAPGQNGHYRPKSTVVCRRK